jgi:hypothetical protein
MEWIRWEKGIRMVPESGCIRRRWRAEGGLRAAVAGGALCLLHGAASAAPFSDPLGDAQTGAYVTYDITSIDAIYSATHLTFSIQLSSAPVAPSVSQFQAIYGFIDIDIDQNIVTGATATIDTIGSGFGTTGLKIEYYLDFFSEASHAGFVDLKDPINVSNVNQVPITYGASSISVQVALSLLGNDDGVVNYAVAVGDYGFATDQALDPMVVMMGGVPASSSPVPEPATPGLVALGLLALAAGRTKPEMHRPVSARASRGRHLDPTLRARRSCRRGGARS